MRKPALDDLAAFAAVARHRSFRTAARRTGVSASTLSQRLRDLEADLGLRLLTRTTRSVAPTDAGARLLDSLGPALGAIDAALAGLAAAGGEPAGTLRINAPPPAIDLVLAPLIPDFLADHPHVRVDVVGESSLVDIVSAGFDAGVRWGEDLADDMIAVPLSGPQRYAVVASPGLLDRVGRPETPEDLLGKPMVGLSFPDGRTPPWEFERAGRTVRIRPAGPLTASGTALHLAAARQGLGFCSTFADYVRDDVAAGRLVSVLEDWLPPFPGPFLYYPRNPFTPPPLAAFAAWLRRRRPGSRLPSEAGPDRPLPVPAPEPPA